MRRHVHVEFFRSTSLNLLILSQPLNSPPPPPPRPLAHASAAASSSDAAAVSAAAAASAPTTQETSTSIQTSQTQSPQPSKAYPFAEIEAKWQRVWDQHQTFRTPDLPGELDTSRPKAYVLDMFPYPSGAGLHVGHPEGYTATDIVARAARMRGRNVLHPIGWDAFGLPAEQYAIQTGTHPAVTTVREGGVEWWLGGGGGLVFGCFFITFLEVGSAERLWGKKGGARKSPSISSSAAAARSKKCF